MANCPNCGSEHIQLKRDTNVDWGRAVAGWALFGVIGGAVGAVTGENRNANVCLDCGTSWRAADLYKTRQTIKDLTGKTLDLSRAKDRKLINDFVSQIGPYIETISTVNKDSEKRIEQIKTKESENAAAGCGYGCLTAIGGCTVVATATSSGLVLIALLIPPILGMIIGSAIDKGNQKTLEREMEKAIKEKEINKIKAEETLKQKVIEFMASHS